MRMKTKSEPKRIAVSLKSADEVPDGLGGGGEGELGVEQEPIEAPLGPMTPVEMLLHDSMKFGRGGFLGSLPLEQQRKSSILNPTVLPAGLAQVQNQDPLGFSSIFQLNKCLYSCVKSQCMISNLKGDWKPRNC